MPFFFLGALIGGIALILSALASDDTSILDESELHAFDDEAGDWCDDEYSAILSNRPPFLVEWFVCRYVDKAGASIQKIRPCVVIDDRGEEILVCELTSQDHSDRNFSDRCYVPVSRESAASYDKKAQPGFVVVRLEPTRVPAEDRAYPSRTPGHLTTADSRRLQAALAEYWVK